MKILAHCKALYFKISVPVSGGPGHVLVAHVSSDIGVHRLSHHHMTMLKDPHMSRVTGRDRRYPLTETKL
jgi:hypothetical protein